MRNWRSFQAYLCLQMHCLVHLSGDSVLQTSWGDTSTLHPTLLYPYSHSLNFLNTEEFQFSQHGRVSDINLKPFSWCQFYIVYFSQIKIESCDNQACYHFTWKLCLISKYWTTKTINVSCHGFFVSYLYKFDTNHWSAVYKHKVGNDYKLKAGYDNETRLGWASLWVSFSFHVFITKFQGFLSAWLSWKNVQYGIWMKLFDLLSFCLNISPT